MQNAKIRFTNLCALCELCVLKISRKDAKGANKSRKGRKGKKQCKAENSKSLFFRFHVCVISRLNLFSTTT
jgi:hypothetical protein